MKESKQLNTVANEQEKQEALKAMFLQMEKRFGKGTVMRMGDKGVQQVELTIANGNVNVFTYFVPVEYLKYLDYMTIVSHDLVSCPYELFQKVFHN